MNVPEVVCPFVKNARTVEQTRTFHVRLCEMSVLVERTMGIVPGDQSTSSKLPTPSRRNNGSKPWYKLRTKHWDKTLKNPQWTFNSLHDRVLGLVPYKICTGLGPIFPSQRRRNLLKWPLRYRGTSLMRNIPPPP